MNLHDFVNGKCGKSSRAYVVSGLQLMRESYLVKFSSHALSVTVLG